MRAPSPFLQQIDVDTEAFFVALDGSAGRHDRDELWLFIRRG